MRNLLKETKSAIAAVSKTPADITFIGSVKSGHACTWAEFEKLADVEYDNGYGAAEVATDLVILFADSTWLERGEYDGSEWWDYRSPPRPPAKCKPVTRLIGDLWKGLGEVNGEEDNSY